MSAVLVAEVQVVMFRQVGKVRDMNIKLTVVFETSFLTSIRFKRIDVDTKGYAGFATIAIRPVSEHAASPETFCNQL